MFEFCHLNFPIMPLDFYVKQQPQKSFFDFVKEGENSVAKSPLNLLGRGMIFSGALILFYILWVFVGYQKEVLDLRQRMNSLEVLGVTQNNSTGASLAAGTTPNTSSFSFGDLLNSFRVGQSDPGLSIKESDLQSQKGILGLKAVDPAVPSEFSLTIPSLNLDKIKVRTNVDGANKDAYLPILKEAVAHFSGTALPGQEGSVFLFGHSTLPIFNHGQYEGIFTYLLNIKKGDEVILNYNNRDYYYQIIETRVVKPSDYTVLNQPIGKSLITLMTCDPPGFGTQRFLAIGELIPL